VIGHAILNTLCDLLVGLGVVSALGLFLVLIWCAYCFSPLAQKERT
jgi:hypothetical protein